MATSSQELPLAAEFPQASREQWRKLVDGVLKGASFDDALVSETYDGLRIEPLNERSQAPPIAGRPPNRTWQVLQRVDHPEPAAANAQALDDLENGATGLSLVFADVAGGHGCGLDASSAALTSPRSRMASAWRLPASSSPEFRPRTPNIGTKCAASPANRTRPLRYCGRVRHLAL